MTKDELPVISPDEDPFNADWPKRSLGDVTIEELWRWRELLRSQGWTEEQLRGVPILYWHWDELEALNDTLGKGEA